MTKLSSNNTNWMFLLSDVIYALEKKDLRGLRLLSCSIIATICLLLLLLGTKGEGWGLFKVGSSMIWGISGKVLDLANLGVVHVVL